MTTTRLGRTPLGALYRTSLGALSLGEVVEPAISNLSLGFSFALSGPPDTAIGQVLCEGGTSNFNYWILNTGGPPEHPGIADPVDPTIYYVQWGDLSVMAWDHATGCMQLVNTTPDIPGYRWGIWGIDLDPGGGLEYSVIFRIGSTTAVDPSGFSPHPIEGDCYFVYTATPPTPQLPPISDVSVSRDDSTVEIPLDVADQCAPVCSVQSGPPWLSTRVKTNYLVDWVAEFDATTDTLGTTPVTIRCANAWGFTEQTFSITVTEPLVAMSGTCTIASFNQANFERWVDYSDCSFFNSNAVSAGSDILWFTLEHGGQVPPLTEAGFLGWTITGQTSGASFVVSSYAVNYICGAWDGGSTWRGYNGGRTRPSPGTLPDDWVHEYQTDMRATGTQILMEVYGAKRFGANLPSFIQNEAVVATPP